MRKVVVAGGNALQKRGEPMTVENQRENARVACKAHSPVAMGTNWWSPTGNGPRSAF